MIVTAFNSAVYNASFIHAAIDGSAKLENIAMKKNAQLPAIACRRYAKMLGTKLWADWCCVLEHAMATFMSTLHGHLAHIFMEKRFCPKELWRPILNQAAGSCECVKTLWDL